MGKSEVQFRIDERSLRGADCSLRRGNGRIRLFGRLLVGIQLALRNRSGPRERSITLQVDLCEVALSLRLGKLSFRLRNLGFRLIDSSLKWTRVNLKEDLVLSDRRAFPVLLADQIAGHLG